MPRGNLLPLLALFLLPACCFASVVINEVCYDPAGADEGWEWIELYNSGPETVDLAGALILSGGSSYSLVCTLPHFLLRPERFILIGEANVTQAAVITPLGFQNGGSESDAIQYIGPDGEYTDTVVYDSPNTNNLTDDSGSTATHFAPDVPEGHSLARVMDGFDTDDCGFDFISEANPTPGLPNRLYVNYALAHANTWQEDGDWLLGVHVKNLSPISPLVTATLSVWMDDILVASGSVCGLTANDSLYYQFTLPVSDNQDHQIGILLELPEDPDTSDNFLQLSLFGLPQGTPQLNELMYYPPTGRQEWIEIHVAQHADAAFLPSNKSHSHKTSYSISDEAGNHFSFSLPSAAGYYVLCGSGSELLADYAACPPAAVIEVTGWAQLNNSGDTVLLHDPEGAVIDSVSYSGSSAQQGKSLERYLTDQGEPAWRFSFDASGATPGRQNSSPVSVPPNLEGRLNLLGSPCKARAGELISIYYQLEQPSHRANCRIYDRAGSLVRILADNLSIASDGALFWDGKDHQGNYLPRGLYYLVWESKPSSGGKLFRRQLTAVLYD
jgi:hypothetical protein